MASAKLLVIDIRVREEIFSDLNGAAKDVITLGEPSGLEALIKGLGT